jgi:hypothetical protein
MSNEPGHVGDGRPYPRQPRDGRLPQRWWRRHLWGAAALGVAAVVAGCALVMGAGLGVLYAFNPMGDEWVCSDGEAPAGKPGRYNVCYEEGSNLPPGARWDPLGNRPMPSNCDKEGWVAIERTVTRPGETEPERDCVREGTDLSGRWRPVED